MSIPNVEKEIKFVKKMPQGFQQPEFRSEMTFFLRVQFKKFSPRLSVCICVCVCVCVFDREREEVEVGVGLKRAITFLGWPTLKMLNWAK